MPSPLPYSEITLRQALEQGVQARRHIHAHPELSGQEAKTAHFIKKSLYNWKWEILSIPSSHSFLAYWNALAPRTLGLRVELDALPLTEQTNLPYSSTHQGIMHACGHDMHMGIAVALAHTIAHATTPPPANILLAFESSEEKLPGGAQQIIESEPFRAHLPTHMFALHCEPTLGVGEIGIAEGAYMASGDEIYITITGRGGHAALPHTLIDPLLTAAHMLIAMQTITSRLAPPNTPTVLSFGRIEHTGAMNLIPDTARLEGTLRTHCSTWRQEAKELIARIAINTAATHGATADVEILAGYPPLYNSASLAQAAQRILNSTPEIHRVVPLEPRMTTDDFSYFAQILPSLFLRLGVGETGNLHSATFCPNEGAMGIGLTALLSLIHTLP